MKIKFEHSLITVFLLCGCNRQTGDFLSNPRKIHGEAIAADCLIGSPVEIVCSDSYLFFYDRYDGQMITMLDAANGRRLRRFINEGQGPDDALPPLKLSVAEGGKLEVFQIQNGRMREYDAGSLADATTKDPFRERVLEDRPANVRKTADGFVGIGMYEDGRYRLYDETGKAVGAVGRYPFRGKDMSAQEAFFLYQGVLCASPDGTHFALGSAYCDNLEFYRVEKGGATPVRQYETVDVSGHFDRQVILDDDCVMNYKAACGTERYCYMLYSGEKFGERHVRSTGGKTVIVFDWKGNHVRTLETAETVYSFCVDEANGILYAVTRDGEEGFVITRYKL
ncbi:MAG: TolB-like 6-bladed beta-propeller domain-containing protein [Tannerella sp.]|jgi:hypothetical protein|nr:TolB-like 6-bladed beta-propeller domain-containing protein [Tannerella sp.]